MTDTETGNKNKIKNLCSSKREIVLVHIKSYGQTNHIVKEEVIVLDQGQQKVGGRVLLSHFFQWEIYPPGYLKISEKFIN